MEIRITGKSKEIAALVWEIQKRQKKPSWEPNRVSKPKSCNIQTLEKRIAVLEAHSKRCHVGHCKTCGMSFDLDDKYCGKCGEVI